MQFTNYLEATISKKHLLNHEFYQAWNEGKIPLETLRLYARQYYNHVKAFPRYLSATHSNCEDIQARQFLLENLNDEEQGSENHPELWLRFAEGLGEDRNNVKNAEPLPEIVDLVNAFLGISRESYAGGLGALYTYESQIPEIAKFKIEALTKHYSITEASTLRFFEVHQQADIYHRRTISNLLEDLSPKDKETAVEASKLIADKLWGFLDGIHGTMLN
ncbi:MAG: CADD family putative folate metabolism protein [Bdellovibrionia bacterium]